MLKSDYSNILRTFRFGSKSQSSCGLIVETHENTVAFIFASLSVKEVIIPTVPFPQFCKRGNEIIYVSFYKL